MQRMRFWTSGNHPHSDVLKDTARYPIHLQWYYLLYNFVLLKSRCCHPSLRVRILSRVYAARGGSVTRWRHHHQYLFWSCTNSAHRATPNILPTNLPETCWGSKATLLGGNPSTVRKFIAHVVLSTLNLCDFPLLWVKWDLDHEHLLP